MLPALLFSVFPNLFIYLILSRGCERLRERHAALSVVVTYLSSPAFVSPLIATKYDQLAPYLCLWALWGIVETFFFPPTGTNQDNRATVWWTEGEKKQGRETGRDVTAEGLWV